MSDITLKTYINPPFTHTIYGANIGSLNQFFRQWRLWNDNKRIRYINSMYPHYKKFLEKRISYN